MMRPFSDQETLMNKTWFGFYFVGSDTHPKRNGKANAKNLMRVSMNVLTEASAVLQRAGFGAVLYEGYGNKASPCKYT